MSALAASGESLLLAQADEIVLPPGCIAVSTASAVQMIAERPLARFDDERVERLSEADAAEMLALATLTKPGPFTLKAQSLGDFWGVKRNGRLAAMAGERMKQTGYTELSGVCAHPDFQGRGLGRLLSLFVAGRICEQGRPALPPRLCDEHGGNRSLRVDRLQAQEQDERGGGPAGGLAPGPTLAVTAAKSQSEPQSLPTPLQP